MSETATKIFVCGIITIGVIFVYHQYSLDNEKDKSNLLMGLFSSKTEHFEPPQNLPSGIDSLQHQLQHQLKNTELLEIIRELKKENESLKEYNEQLHQKILEIDKKVNNRSNKNVDSSVPRPRLSEISKVKLEAHIEKMLKDKSINIKYLPDFVEEALYRNIFGMLLNLLDYTLETANIELLGQQLQLDLKAPSKDEENTEEDIQKALLESQ